MNDIPSAPHIYFWSIYGSPKEKFWRSIPKGYDPVCVIGSPALLIKSCQPEISQLEFAPVIDKDVRPFDIPMNHSFVVEIGQTSKHLMTEGFEVCV